MALVLPSLSVSAADGMKRGEWLTQMRGLMPALFCKKETIFRRCFKVKQDACESAVSEMGSSCATEIEKQMPKKVPDKEGEKWGEKLGYCVGQAFWRRFEDKYKNDKKCNKELSS